VERRLQRIVAEAVGPDRARQDEQTIIMIVAEKRPRRKSRRGV